MKHQCFRDKEIKNINEPYCLHRNDRCFINVASMSHRCLCNEQACFFLLMTTLMNHQCYQGVLDWGSDGQLQKSGSDSPLVVVYGRFSWELLDLSIEVLQHSSKVDWGSYFNARKHWWILPTGNWRQFRLIVSLRI